MPLVRLETNERLSQNTKTTLCDELSHACAEVIGKPEAYVMSIVADDVVMQHGGEQGPAAFVEVHSIGGLSRTTNQALTQRLCTLISRATHVRNDRIYVTFTDVAATHWGQNGRTFG